MVVGEDQVQYVVVQNCWWIVGCCCVQFEFVYQCLLFGVKDGLVMDVVDYFVLGDIDELCVWIVGYFVCCLMIECDGESILECVFGQVEIVDEVD